MEERDKVLVIGDRREAMLRALYPDESGAFQGITINIGPDPRIVEAERELRAIKRAAREQEARRLRLADFDRAHPITDGDRERMAAAEAKRARRRARNLKAS